MQFSTAPARQIRDARDYVRLNAPALEVAIGDEHGCAILEGGDVQCWGHDNHGALNYPELGGDNVIDIVSLPHDLGTVDLGGETAVQIDAAKTSVCVRLESGGLRCWGNDSWRNLRGEDEPYFIEDMGFIDVSVAETVTCGVLEDRRLFCWGDNFHKQVAPDGPNSGNFAQIDLGGDAAQVSVGRDHVCARLVSGGVRCWGQNGAGRLGYGPNVAVGGDTSPAEAGDLPLGAAAADRCHGGLVMEPPKWPVHRPARTHSRTRPDAEPMRGKAVAPRSRSTHPVELLGRCTCGRDRRRVAGDSERRQDPLDRTRSHDGGATPPDAETKEAFRELVRRTSDKLRAHAVAFEAKGIAGSLIRTVMCTTGVVLRPGYPQQIFADADDAARWLYEELIQDGEDLSLTRRDLHEALDRILRRDRAA